MEDEISSFFESSPPQKNMEEILENLNEFIKLNSSSQGKIIAVDYIRDIIELLKMIQRVFKFQGEGGLYV
jgi:hypothetical protein